MSHGELSVLSPELPQNCPLAIAEEMTLPKEETEPLKYAALLHDIGKIGIRDDVLTSLRDYPKYAFGQTLDCEPIPLAQVIDLLRDQAGTQFDPQVVNTFMKSLARSLLRYRVEHFSPAYVDDTIRAFNPELLS